MICIQKRKRQISGISPKRSLVMATIEKYQELFLTSTDDKTTLQAMITIEHLESQL